VDDAMYMYDDVMLNYRTWIAGGGNANDGFVTPTQAVFFHGDGTVPAYSFDFTDAERYHTDYPYYKADVEDMLSIRVTGGDYIDETFIRFQEQATSEFDGSYDAFKLFSGADFVPSVYTHGGDIPLSINGLPATNKVPLSFKSGVNASFELLAFETSEFNEVYLEDLFDGTITDLLVDSYTFDYSIGDNPNRFMVHFGAVGIGDNDMENVSIWSGENKIYVNIPLELKGNIFVYNMMGQEIISTDTEPGIVNVIPMDKVNTYYVVKVLSNDKVVTGKVYIK